MRGGWIAWSIGVALALVSPAGAAADCGPFRAVPADGRIESVSLLDGQDINFVFGTNASTSGRHSYSIEVVTDAASAAWSAFTGGFGCMAGNDPAFRVTSGAEPRLQTGSGVRGSVQNTTVGSPWVTHVTNNTGQTANFRYRVADTTMYSPSWSTISIYNTYYSLQNTANFACTGTLLLYDTAGQLVSEATVPIGTGSASTNTVALGTPRERAGTAVLLHDCPPGAIVAEAAVASFAASPPYIQTVKFTAVQDRSR